MSYQKITVAHPITGEHFQVQEHVMIWLLSQGLWQKGQISIESGWHIHHIDFNPANNDPSNLTLITASDHSQLHWDHEKGRRKKVSDSLKRDYETKTPEQKAKRIAKAREVSIAKMKREGPTPAQLEGLRKARANAYGGKRFKGN